ncbi:hypothetical protein [Methylocystis sp.]|jgi:hypothetical protein|uniref:hypothetical protein n=1 Tax=Methylocystis sp. TaxID=1911079 RepID=UPI003DA67E0F
MTNRRPSVNGILAAVLSGSIIPIHGALAQKKALAAPSPVVRLPGIWPVKIESAPEAAIEREE